MRYSLTQRQPNITQYGQPDKLRFIFRLWIGVAWLWMLLMGYPLLTYTNTNATMVGRYSPAYATGLLIYLIFLFGWPLLLFLPQRYLSRIVRGVGYLNDNPRARANFVVTWIFLTLLALTTMRCLWGLVYNPLLWLSVAGLGLWWSALPLFWTWGLKGWPIRLVPPERMYDWFSQNPYLWLPLLLGVGVVLVSYYLGFNGSSRQLMLALALVPGLGVLLILWRWPPVGLILLVVTSLIVPSPNFPGGLNVAVLFLMLLIGLPLLKTILERQPLRVLPSRPVWPVLAIIITTMLSFGLGQLRWFYFAQNAPLDAQLGGVAIFILAGAAFLLPAYQIRDLRWLQWLTWVYIALATLQVAGWLVPGLGSITARLFQYGTYDNSLFWVWLVTLTFSQALLNQKLHPGWRLVLGVITLTTLYVAFVKMGDWKSGYLPPLVSIAVILALRSWRLGVIMALVGPIAAVYLLSQAVATESYSYSTRLDALLIMLEIIKVNPIFGFGPANYFWYTPLFPIRGWAVRFNSHNQYVDIVAQTGLVGLACLGWFAAELGWLGWRLRNQVPAGFARAYVYGALGGLAAMLASGAMVDWFFPFVYNIGFSGFRTSMLNWIFLGGLVSLEQIYRHQATPNEAQASKVRPASLTRQTA